MCRISFRHFVLPIFLAVCLFLTGCMPQPARTPSPTAVPTAVPSTETAPPPSPTTTASPSPGYQVLWSYQTKDAIWGTPAVSGNTVFIGSDDGNLYAVGVQTGNLRWRFTTQGLVRSRPAINRETVYFTSDDGFLYAVDAQNGQQVWSTNIGNTVPSDKRRNPGTSTAPSGFDYFQSSPVVALGLVYIGSADGNVYAVDAGTGKIAWTFRTAEKVRATPAIDQGSLYIGSWDGTFYKLDALSGSLQWKALLWGQIQSTALVANGLVYTASRKASVVALDLQSGEKKWEYPYGANMWVESSPQLVGNVIYVGSSGNRVVLGMDSLTGQLLARHQGQVFFWSTPAISGIRLYIGGEVFTKDKPVGGLFCFDLPTTTDAANPAPIKLRWQLSLPETMMPDGNWAGVVSSPVIDDGIVYFGGLDGKIYAVKPDAY